MTKTSAYIIILIIKKLIIFILLLLLLLFINIIIFVTMYNNERGYLWLLLHGLHLPISNKGSFYAPFQSG